jgi:hypothetical protein
MEKGKLPQNTFTVVDIFFLRWWWCGSSVGRTCGGARVSRGEQRQAKNRKNGKKLKKKKIFFVFFDDASKKRKRKRGSALCGRGEREVEEKG